MKSLLFAAVFCSLASTTAFAASAVCPANTKTIAICTSTPTAADSKEAALFASSIALCGSGSMPSMVFQTARGTQPMTAAATFKGTTDSIWTLDNGKKYSLTYATAAGKLPKFSATFAIEIVSAQALIQSTYTCLR